MSFQLWGGTSTGFYLEIVRSCEQTDRSDSQSGVLLASAACSGEGTSAVFLRPFAVMGFATLHFMGRTMKGWRDQKKVIKSQKMENRIRESGSAESWLDQVMTPEKQATKYNRKSLAPGRDFSQNFCMRHFYFCCLENVKHIVGLPSQGRFLLSVHFISVTTKDDWSMPEPVKYILTWINLVKTIASPSMEGINLI